MATKKFMTNYAVAVHWLNTALVLCNNITNIDNSIWENQRFSNFYDSETGEGCDEEDENACERDIYQWYLTDCSESDVEWLEEHFGLLFTYSDLLDVWVLCVDHFGTGWDYVECETDLEQAARKLGEKK